MKKEFASGKDRYAKVEIDEKVRKHHHDKKHKRKMANENKGKKHNYSSDEELHSIINEF